MVIRAGSRVRMLRTYALDFRDAESRKLERGTAVTVTKVAQTAFGSKCYTVTDGFIELGPLPEHVVEPIGHGGKRPGAGRPSSRGQPLSVKVTVWLTESEAAELEAGRADGETLSGLMRDAALAMVRSRKDQ